MNKVELIEQAVELGLDASGTKADLKARLEAHRLLPQEVVSPVIKKHRARQKYLNSAKGK